MNNTSEIQFKDEIIKKYMGSLTFDNIDVNQKIQIMFNHEQ